MAELGTGAVRRGVLAADRIRAFAQARPGVLAGALLAVVAVVAYRFTLVSLAADLSLDTPLAYLPLLPLFSAYLAVAAVRSGPRDAPPREGLVDLVVGVPLLFVALLLVTALPVVSSTYYWSDRPDVLSLALFVIGAVAVCCGVGWVWRLRWALAFLLLMWPGLYLHALAGVLNAFSTATNAALAATVLHLPLGVSAGTSSGSLLVHQPHAAPLTVLVSSACAGSDTALGFVLVGGAIVTTRRGAWWRRLGWLAVGVAAAFALNVARITSILGLAAAGHAQFALNDYHASVGLILFTLLIVVMMVALPVFGLHPAASGRGADGTVDGTPTALAAETVIVGAGPTAAGAEMATPQSRPGVGRPSLQRPSLQRPSLERPSLERPSPRRPSPRRSGRPDPVRVVAARVAAAGTAVQAAIPTPPPTRRSVATAGLWRRRLGRPLTVLALALACGAADAQLGPYAAFADGEGAPTVAAFSPATVPAGWVATPVASYPWASQYFGTGTDWERYLFTPSGGGGGVYADVVQTPHQSALDAYGIQSCFLFHRFRILANRRTQLGAGVTGLTLDYAVEPAQEKWSTVSWAWPVRIGDRTVYERVLLTSAAGTTLAALPTPAAGVSPRPGLVSRWVLGATNGLTSHGGSDTAPAAYEHTNAGVQALAQALVASTLAVPATGAAS